VTGAARILGVDPGSRVTGYGIIDPGSRGSATALANGAIRLTGATLSQRLGLLYRELDGLIQAFEPTVMAVEDVFVHRNPGSALKLGQARGVALCLGALHGLVVAEYSPRRVKQTLVGSGGADKPQMQYMTMALLGLPQTLSCDAADALAVALCHARAQELPAGLTGARRRRSGRRARRLADYGIAE